EHRASRGLTFLLDHVTDLESRFLDGVLRQRLCQAEDWRHVELALPGAHVQHDLGAARLTRARRRRLREHGGLWRELHVALLAGLRLEAGGLEPRHRLVV